MKTISLINSSKVAIVDDEDYDEVSKHRWGARYMSGLWYAHRTKYRNFVSLHRFLLKPPKNMMIDHINGNGLDCRRSNMRLATNRQNQYNARLRKDNTSGYRGVGKRGNKWGAWIKIQGKQTYLGQFDTAEAAAKARDSKARETQGEFAQLNFPNQQEITP